MQILTSLKSRDTQQEDESRSDDTERSPRWSEAQPGER